MSSENPVLDSGNTEYGTHVQVMMHPTTGGSVDLSPATLTRMIGCDPEKVGHCGAALSLDHVEINGANMPCDSHIVLTTTDGKSINTHCANHVDETGNVSGVHANLRAGNVHTGLGVKIPLQPAAYTNGGTRSENMSKSLATAKNWSEHLGKGHSDIMSASISEVKRGLDGSGNTHTRVLVHENGPIGHLVGLNPASDHPIMKVYGKDKLTRVDGKIVMDQSHVEQLAATLADTLTPCTPISAGGLRITVRPMKHAVGQLQKPTAAQLDMKFVRKNIVQVLQHDDAADAGDGVVTTRHLLLNNAADASELQKQEADTHNAIWGAKLGVDASNITPIDAGATIPSAAPIQEAEEPAGGEIGV